MSRLEKDIKWMFEGSFDSLVSCEEFVQVRRVSPAATDSSCQSMLAAGNDECKSDGNSYRLASACARSVTAVTCQQPKMRCVGDVIA